MYIYFISFDCDKRSFIGFKLEMVIIVSYCGEIKSDKKDWNKL